MIGGGSVMLPVPIAEKQSPRPVLTRPVKVSVVAHASGREYCSRLDYCRAAIEGQVGLPEGSEVESILVWSGAVGAAPEWPRVVHRQPDAEAYCRSKACNVGARAATGSLLAFVDADVVLHPEALVRAAAACASGRSFAVIMCRSEKETSRRPLWGLGTLFVPRQAFFAVQGFDEKYVGWGYEDNDLVDRLVAHSLVYINLTAHDGVTATHQEHEMPHAARAVEAKHNKNHYLKATTIIRNQEGWGDRGVP